MGDAVGLIHVMGGEEDGGLLGFVEVLDVGPELVAALRIEAEGGFVEEEDFGGVQEAAGDFEAALHSAGEGFDVGILALPEFEELEQVLGALGAELAGDVVEDSVEVHVFVRGLLVVEAGILEDDAETLAGLLLADGRVEAVELDAAAGGTEQGGEHLDCGGFAGSVGAEEGEDFALGDVEGDVVDGEEIAEFFGEVVDVNHGGVILVDCLIWGLYWMR